MLPSFFFNDTATTEIYTLSLHDALPIYGSGTPARRASSVGQASTAAARSSANSTPVRRSSSGSHSHETMRAMSCTRSEEHTSELQSRQYLVCRLLLEKKKRLLLE